MVAAALLVQQLLRRRRLEALTVAAGGYLPTLLVVSNRLRIVETNMEENTIAALCQPAQGNAQERERPDGWSGWGGV